MANMGYCRFENTLNDLEDCAEHIEDEGLSTSELRARKKLIELCASIGSSWDDPDEDDEDGE